MSTRFPLSPFLNRRGISSLSVLLFISLIAVGCRSLPPNSLSSHNSSRWEKDIATYEANDRTNRPPDGSIVFVGSSSIRLWKTLALDFAPLPVVNRGFGGSQMADSVQFADRIVLPYRPRQVVIYAGTNDINAGKDPELVFGDFVAFVRKIREQSPKAKIAFIACAPNPARWKIVDKMQHLNSLVNDYCDRHGLDFIDIYPLMLGADGLPKPDIFVADRLHMNAKGYEIWTAAVRPYLR